MANQLFASQKSGFVARCLKSHPLVLTHFRTMRRNHPQIYRFGWKCDECGTSQGSKGNSYHCTICCYDLCSNCYPKGYPNSSPNQDDSKSTEEVDDSDSIDPRVMTLLHGGSNKIGDQIMDNSPGVLWSIGNNEYGKHGDGTTNTVKQLTIHHWARDIDFVKVVTNGHGFFCCVCSDGSLWVAGYNNCGQLGLGSGTALVYSTSVTNATKNNHFDNNGLVLKDITCATNGHHQIALTKSGHVFGTGKNSNHELGFSGTSNRTQFTKMPFFEKNKLRVKQVACANLYSTFLTNNGAVYVCGKSLDGGLGFGIIKITKCQTVRKVDALNGKAMRHISCGNGHTLSIDEDGWLWSWGKNNFGQLGNGRKWTRTEKRRNMKMMMMGVMDISDFETDSDAAADGDDTLPQKIGYFVDNKIKTIAIACGYDHNLSLDSRNRVYSWGYNSHSECGHGSLSHVLTPKPIDALKSIDIVDIKAGAYHNVAMSRNYQFYIWGANGSYQCLSGNTSNVRVPTKFNSKRNPQLSGDTVLSIWPGKDATHVIALPKARENQKLKKLLRNEIDSNDGLKRRIQDIQGTLRRERNGNRLTTDKLNRLKTQSDAQKKEYQSLQKEHQNQTNELKKVTSEKTEIQRNLRDRDRNIERMKKEITRRQKMNELREEEIQSKTQQITLQHNEKRAMQQTLRTREQENTSLQSNNDAQKKQIDWMSKEMKKLRETMEAQKIEGHSMKRQTERLQNEVKNRKNDIQSMSKQMDGHAKSLKEREQQIQSQRREIYGLKKAAIVQQKEFGSLEEKLQTQERQNKSMSKKMDKLNETIEVQKTERQSMVQQMNQLKHRVQSKEKENQSKTQQLVRLNERLKVQDKAKQTLQQTLQNREEKNEALQQERERMKDEIKESRKALDEKEKEKWKIVNEVERLKYETKVKDQQIADLKETLNRSYTLNVVEDRGMQSEETKHEDEAKVNPKGHGDHALYKKHCDIVTEWNVLTDKLQKLADPLKRENDDEKQPAEPKQGVLSADKLFCEYVKSNGLINQQKGRLKLVDDSHLNDLVLHQKSLSVKCCLRKKVKNLESERDVKKDKSIEKRSRYQDIHRKRMETVKLIKSAVDECNALILSENRLSTQLKQLSDETAVVEGRLETAQSSSTDCANTISLYETFKEQNQLHIDTISSYYTDQWQSFESRCFEWSAHELVVYFQKTAASDVIDGKHSSLESREQEPNASWKSVEQKLIDSKISGKHLPHFGPNTVSFTGIQDKNLSVKLVSSMIGLVQRHSSDFAKLWNEIEAKWRDWTSEDLTEWLKYQSLNLDGGAIDWEMTYSVLKSQKLNGEKLRMINEAMFPFLGITDKRTIDHLVSCIEKLLNTPNAKNTGVKRQDVKVPSEFLCQISKEIMKDPVLASDGHTYERANIESYLKQHNKSPVTGEPMQHSFVFPNHSLKQRIDKFIDENKHKIEESIAAENEVEGDEQEGMVTGYI